MRTYLDCLPCFVRQALDVVRLTGLDEARAGRLMRRVFLEMARLNYEDPPPVLSARIHRLVREEFPEVGDPYAPLKREYNRRALALLPELRRLVEASPDPLDTALRLAVAGNVIDFGLRRPDENIELPGLVRDVLDADFGVDHRAAFGECVQSARKVLWIGDNAGEIVFDRVLVEWLAARGIEVGYAVRGRPILNDVTVEDARQTGLTEIATVIDSGSAIPGVDFTSATPAFLEWFRDADVVVAKGQGNYETLSDHPRPGLFLLLKAKCPVIARDIGCGTGDFVLVENAPAAVRETGGSEPAANVAAGRADAVRDPAPDSAGADDNSEGKRSVEEPPIEELLAELQRPSSIEELFRGGIDPKAEERRREIRARVERWISGHAAEPESSDARERSEADEEA